MHMVMPTKGPLYARQYSKGRGPNDDQVKQGHCPIRAYILGKVSDDKQGNGDSK